jgi:hypothetical protein
MSENKPPELIATAPFQTFTLQKRPTKIEVYFKQTNRVKSILEQLSESKTSLNASFILEFSNIKGTEIAPLIDVYLNATEVENAENILLDQMALYGLKSYSSKNNNDESHGLSEVWEVGDALKKARNKNNWSNEQFTLTLAAPKLASDLSLTVERISLFYCGNV